MKAVVVDASVAIKWFVPEADSDAVTQLLDDDVALLAPDLIVSEVTNTLWKKIGRGEITRDEAAQILTAFRSVGVELYPAEALAQAALELACALGCTVYDALYLALAIARDCVVITADRRFHALVSASPWCHRARLP